MASVDSFLGIYFWWLLTLIISVDYFKNQLFTWSTDLEINCIELRDCDILVIFLSLFSIIKQEACRPDSSAIYNWLSGHRKLESVRTLLKITCLAHRKSYLVFICSNSHGQLTKSEIRSSWDSVRTLLKITHQASRKSYLIIVCPNSYLWSLYVYRVYMLIIKNKHLLVLNN